MTVKLLTYEEIDLITRIALRANAFAAQHNVKYSPIVAALDIAACHKIVPLRLAELLVDANDSDFAHDVFGIRQHLDRETGRLLNCFSPHYAKRNLGVKPIDAPGADGSVGHVD